MTKYAARKLATSANALAKLEMGHPRFFDTLAQELLRDNAYKLRQCNTLNISLIANSFAKFRIKNPELFQAIARELLRDSARKLNSSAVHHLVLIANAFAKLECEHCELFQTIKRIILSDLTCLNDPQQCATIANSFAKFQIQSPDL